MKQPRFAKSLHLLFIAALMALLAPAMIPIPLARAQQATPISDLAVNLVSMPKHAKACEVFQAIDTVTNLGPDPASSITVGVHPPDAYNEVAILSAPESLAVRETATFSVVVWVGRVEPGENRRA